MTTLDLFTNTKHARQPKPEEIPVIIKWEGGAGGNAVLFFPTFSANIGNIVCYAWQGQHCEASLDYYKGLRNVKTASEVREAWELLKHYTAHYCTPPSRDGITAETPQTLRTVKRDCEAFRKQRYSWKENKA